MKKLQVLGLTESAATEVLTLLWRHSCDFIVEDLPDEDPAQAHLTVQPVHPQLQPPEPVGAKPPAEPVPHRIDGQRYPDINKPLPGRILEWVAEAKEPIHRDILRELASQIGYAPGSVNAAISGLKHKSQVSTDGQYVSLGLQPKGLGSRYAKPVQEIVLDVLTDRTMPRHELVNEMAELGVHKPTADVAVNKALRSGLLHYIGEGNLIVAGPAPDPEAALLAGAEVSVVSPSLDFTQIANAFQETMNNV